MPKISPPTPFTLAIDGFITGVVFAMGPGSLALCFLLTLILSVYMRQEWDNGTLIREAQVGSAILQILGWIGLSVVVGGALVYIATAVTVLSCLAVIYRVTTTSDWKKSVAESDGEGWL